MDLLLLERVGEWIYNYPYEILNVHVQKYLYYFPHSRLKLPKDAEMAQQVRGKLETLAKGMFALGILRGNSEKPNRKSFVGFVLCSCLAVTQAAMSYS